jgi:hypothetical protein
VIEHAPQLLLAQRAHIDRVIDGRRRLRRFLCEPREPPQHFAPTHALDGDNGHTQALGDEKQHTITRL